VRTFAIFDQSGRILRLVTTAEQSARRRLRPGEDLLEVPSGTSGRTYRIDPATRELVARADPLPPIRRDPPLGQLTPPAPDILAHRARLRARLGDAAFLRKAVAALVDRGLLDELAE
jgi:hypothetical protein